MTTNSSESENLQALASRLKAASKWPADHFNLVSEVDAVVESLEHIAKSDNEGSVTIPPGKPAPQSVSFAESPTGVATIVYESSTPERSRSEQPNYQRIVWSIVTMLGWGNMPPQRVIEQEIAALKARANGYQAPLKAVIIQPADRAVWPHTLDTKWCGDYEMGTQHEGD